MSDSSFGNTLRARVFSLVNILITKANSVKQEEAEQEQAIHSRDSVEDYRIIFDPDPNEPKLTSKLVVTTTVDALSKLVREYLLSANLNEELWREPIAQVWRELDEISPEKRQEVRKKDIISALNSLRQGEKPAQNNEPKQNPLLNYAIDHNADLTYKGQGQKVRKFTIKLVSGNPEEDIAFFETKWPYEEVTKAEPITQPPVPSANRRSEITLRIGLASESSKPIKKFLQDFESMSDHFLMNMCNFPKFKFGEITIIENYDTSQQQLKDRHEDYDIIMIDDPWIAAYSDIIAPIGETILFKRFLDSLDKKDELFGKVFHKSLEQVCADDEGQILVLPVIGNVQMAVFRDDSQEAVKSFLNSNLKLQKKFKHLINSEGHLVMDSPQHIKDICEINSSLNYKYSICYRDYGRTSDVVVFWELLRILDHQDDVRDHIVSIEREKAYQALELLKKLSRVTKAPKGKLNLYEKEAKMIATIGWPSWDSEEQKKELPGFDQIQFRKLSNRSVMGAWTLALTKKSQYKEEAAQIILLLTANQGVQSILAQQGNPTVLNNLDRPPENSCWANNCKEIDAAIQKSIPRPRSKYWPQIEAELSRQIDNGEFMDYPTESPFLVFTPRR
jgi:hypothetical protein